MEDVRACFFETANTPPLSSCESGFFVYICAGDVTSVKKPQLHLISNGKMGPEELAGVVRQAAPFVDYVHIREKTRTALEVAEFLQQLKACLPPDRIVVNDRVDAAVAGGIRRVHLAWHSLDVRSVKRAFPDLTVGRSVHAFREALEAEKQGADYLIYGHLFPSGSKQGLPPRGTEELARITAAVRIPVIAIGGIRPDNCARALQAGAAGVAVMSGILDSREPAAAAEKYALALQQAMNGGEYHGEI